MADVEKVLFEKRQEWIRETTIAWEKAHGEEKTKRISDEATTPQ